jgi:hypothetical protein
VPDYPPAALTAAAEAIERELMSGKDYSMAADSGEALARVALDAAAPILAEAVAQKVLTHANRRPGAGKVLTGMLGAWHRHFGIAARVAAGAFSTQEEEKRAVAEAIGRGDFVACDIPEVPDA